MLLLAFPCALTAQTQQSSWSSLNRLKVGQGIEVVEASLKHHSGKFVTVTDELVTLKENGSDVSLKRADVMRVSTSSAPRRGEHALIGLLVGAAAGAGLGAGFGTGPASGSSGGFIDSRGIGALIGIASGGPSGALIGAALPAHKTVYRAAPAAASH
ncbi:MAG TPA: hypothetical protein VHF01_09720 [Candidatus Acidoferrum sp.]|nr:hypothetical protein [Candidatus Acidoferrum sp.]